MDYARIGKHEVAACPHCDQLFDVVCDGQADGMDTICDLYQEHLAASPACKAANDCLPDLISATEQLRPAFKLAEENRQERLATNPDNGILGYWLVEGIRHDARCQATSALEAVAKCMATGAIGTWESPEATFIGKQLPEVF